ncbi:MAG: hypothetical protein GZ085_09720 [Sulfuriferula multivorans]|uniref:Tryptophan synthase subunit beta like protein n=1 Tax=Sulfuriferula multivorans TaxID=1559896 RepID=A0A7C9P790_9PROT|nr:hypothetical protein [Sulfuriferula multivorans]
MPFVKRDPSGHIIAASATPTDSDDQEITADAPELQTFLAVMGGEIKPLETSDLKFIRAIEDLIDVLITKNVIRITDLPVAVQSKLMERRSMRQTLGALNLLSGTDETI